MGTDAGAGAVRAAVAQGHGARQRAGRRRQALPRPGADPDHRPRQLRGMRGRARRRPDRHARTAGTGHLGRALGGMVVAHARLQRTRRQRRLHRADAAHQRRHQRTGRPSAPLEGRHRGAGLKRHGTMKKRGYGIHRNPFSLHWWASRESNTAPTDYESAALTRHELEALGSV
ncbi:hypothetical protein CBM2586_A60092 [Cupriavidus phytorum]|uniref:Uncharacterized protein n=1 Tax=Cupriavidus taiwanensis TaxID=164546 RepID=A0A975XAE6_9BURK|nr:hypothetical protein CBM2586_A60092 [Cupriavidus taiwanensis]